MESFPKRIVLKHPVRESSRQDVSAIPVAYKGVMVLGALCFFSAVVAGIWRIALTRGFLLPSIPEWFPPHGHLMVGGFLGAVIMLERFLGLRESRLIWVPYAYSLTAIFLHTGFWPVRVLHVIALAGWLLHRWLAFRAFHHMEKPLAEAVAYLTLSSALMFPGGLPARPDVALAALSFPATAIFVERLELSLSFRKRGVRIVFWGLIAWSLCWTLSVWFSSTVFELIPIRWMGILTLLLTISVAYYDTALRFSGPETAQGMYRYLRVALRFAYTWLFAGSLAMICWTVIPAAIVKDVLFHLMGLGFIFTMILAHAPLILPSALGKLPSQKAPWIPFVIFQLMTTIRILGDFSVLYGMSAWMWSGWITGTVHLLSFLLLIVTVVNPKNN